MKFTSIFVVLSVLAQQALSGAIPFTENGPNSLEARQNNRFRGGNGRGGNNRNRVVIKKPVHRMKPKLRHPPSRNPPKRKPVTTAKPKPAVKTTTAKATSTKAAAAATTTSAKAAASSPPPANNNNNNNGGNNNNNNGGNNNGGQNTPAGGAAGGGGGGNPQTSLQLDPSTIGANLAKDGLAANEPGQVASLTSTNNYINFCVGKTITNGQQVVGGSCNPVPMGDIPAKANIPSCKFQFPANGGTIPANQDFTIRLSVSNLDTGNFVNAQTNYYSAPQQLNGQGIIIAHSHVVVEKIQALDTTAVTDPTVFAFFKGLNAEAAGGVLSATVTGGLAAGFYKVSSINTAANHQPVLAPVAQHGSMDDVVYFTVA